MEEKKQSIFHLTKEEKLELENSLLKEQNLSFQVQSLQNERQKLVNDFCKRVDQQPEDILRWDLNAGIAEFKSDKKDEKNGAKNKH